MFLLSLWSLSILKHGAPFSSYFLEQMKNLKNSLQTVHQAACYFSIAVDQRDQLAVT